MFAVVETTEVFGGSCDPECRAGNREFLTAESSTLRRLRDMALPEVDYFLEHFMPGFEKNLDELGTLDE